jgi:hypothetical protein
MSAKADGVGPLNSHAVRLHLRDDITVDKRRLQATLRKRCGNVVPLDEASPDLAFLHLDHVTDRGVPAQFAVGRDHGGGADDAVVQAWNWPGARNAVDRSRAWLTVADRSAENLPRASRLRLLHGAVASVMELAPVTALHWLSSDRLVDPAAYFEMTTDLLRFVGASVNARLFGVKSPESGEAVMDTLGLAAFGLPDLQIHYRGLDHNRLATWLYNLAAFIFEKGDVLENGNAVPGLEPDSPWTCRREWSLVAPKREVVDINPGRA